jgi:hypothetical protein
VWGVMGNALAIFAFILLWFMIIISFKCTGPSRVGLFSGRLKPRQAKPVTAAANTDESLQLRPEDSKTNIEEPKDYPSNNEEHFRDKGVSEENVAPDDSASNNEEPKVSARNDEESLQDKCCVSEENASPNNPATNNEEPEGSASNNEEPFQDKGVSEENLAPDDSARNNEQPEEPASNNEESVKGKGVSEKNAALKRQKRRLRRARIAVLICSLGITISVVIMLTQGIQSLKTASNDALDGIVKAQSLTNEGISLLDDFITRQNAALNASRALVEEFNSYCPSVREEICINVTTDPICNFTDIPFADELEAFITTYRDVVYRRLNNSRADLIDFGNLLDKLHSKADNYYWAFIAASVFAGLLLGLNLFVAYGVIIAWRKKSRTNFLRKVLALLRHWLLVPTFVFFVVMSWIFSMVFVIGSITSADFCVDSPDDRVATLLVKEGNFKGSWVLELLLYYITGCSVDIVPMDLVDHIIQISGVFKALVALVGQLASAAVDVFQEQCGTDPALYQAAATALEGRICNLGQTVVDVQNYFSCENWRPLYTIVTYNAVCYNSNEGFYYVTITQLCIVIFAMIMLTLRVAFYEVEVENGQGELASDKAETEEEKGQGKVTPDEVETQEEKGQGELAADSANPEHLRSTPLAGPGEATYDAPDHVEGFGGRRRSRPLFSLNRSRYPLVV